MSKINKIENLSELNLLTKSQLQCISSDLFKNRLSGLKEDFIKCLNRNFSNYGNNKYDVILVNLVLSFKAKKSTEIIKTESILIMNYLNSYEKYLYTYYLGFNSLFNKYREEEGRIKSYILDPSHIFDNQFNTLSGERISEGCKLIIPSSGYKKLSALRDNIFSCGYCGKQYNKEKALKVEFCEKCRGSEHLEVRNYPLLKLTQISSKRDYKNIIVPSHIKEDIKAKQSKTKKALIIKDIERAKKRIIDKIAENKKEVEVLNYLLSNDFLNDFYGLFIYYNHSNTLSFKWNNEKMTP